MTSCLDYVENVVYAHICCVVHLLIAVDLISLKVIVFICSVLFFVQGLVRHGEIYKRKRKMSCILG